ncbi:MAG TPA: peptidylprolyl isomerase [Humisphaera sp.]|jgi:FKBP-type peptidyl-prolyl cis-trans isomerase SlyD|nr:peptidylprolyl isomerase [Humisphaera sp.]
MQIAKHKVVTFDYTLTDQAGATLDSSKGRQPLTYLHGIGQIIPGVERALEGKTAGEHVEVDVIPGDAYGEHDPRRIQKVPRSSFANVPKIEKGMQFEARGPTGDKHNVTVTDIDDQTVTVDGNHPLAGKTLHFDIMIVTVRDSTPEEQQHGHAHGPGGHQH